ncbi:hypothetical protein JYU15_02080 [bacterium AH-315-I18]|nr:hypothetical protein [Phycisphaeraceae bacterium]MBN4061204.1 hypothetical protein [bacterium AH-315-I18]
MTPFDMTQAITAYLIAESNTNAHLQLVVSQMYLQHVPESALLPHLQISIGDVQHESDAVQSLDFSGKIQLTLASSLSQGTQQISGIQNALITKLDRKQLLIPPNLLLQIWLDKTQEPEIQRDRIVLSSTWQCRLNG